MEKNLTKWLAEAMVLTGVLTILGCASLGAPVTVKRTAEGNNVIHLKASSFEFEPNNVKIPKPGPLTVIVENISGTEHNFTIKNPEGQVLESFVLPPKKTISETLDLTDFGKYEFYCDKLFHATLGMKGQIQVGP
jgi:plastocyanin